ncbi:MAG TPA: valine--tRNA ligase, partial [Candidatus Omnitrophota bacterium]|nr:valine--tRNA ligase [Candidatus Omnitrophota bacterium]
VFVRLYDKGLIYRGKRIINWCPRCQTALSDEEAEHREQQGALYYIRYPLQGNPDTYLIVATTRPETMLGDTGVAVHPDDARYKNFIGQKVVLPILQREIPIIADAFVNREFGTGAVKVTPAHDPNDFAMGTRHHLDPINILHPDGVLNENAGDFAGLDRFEAREAIIETLKELKLLEKVEPHTHAVGHCYRCHTVVEPYLSQQWFVKMAPLAQPALQAVLDGKITFTPDRWTKVYLNWMENIRDWCISRQIWWGHRIPVWYCQNCQEGENIIVAQTEPKTCPRCQSSQLVQEEDVLDTWFSSWLWPFATFGWPPQKGDDREGKDNEETLRYFYPTNALFTASEIIFFWVARMIMAGLEFMGEIPFSDVHIHGTVRDAQGRKMSKSLGNAIDPLEIIQEYGADALRFSLIINSGQDIYISKEKFEVGRNFANKIWNASRLILSNIPEHQRQPDLWMTVPPDQFDLPTRWIISRFYSTLDGLSKAIETFHFSEAESLLYEFFWKNFCDWYLEINKARFSDPVIGSVIFFLLEQSIRLIHPFMPFVTEEIFSQIHEKSGPLAVQSWPGTRQEWISPDAEKDMQLIMDIITQLRNIKAQWQMKPGQTIDCCLSCEDPGQLAFLKTSATVIQTAIKIGTLTFSTELPGTTGQATGLVDKTTVSVPLSGIIDVLQEKKRITQQLQDIQKFITNLDRRLGNDAFVQKAPADVIQKERERLIDFQNKKQELEKLLNSLD